MTDEQGTKAILELGKAVERLSSEIWGQEMAFFLLLVPFSPEFSIQRTDGNLASNMSAETVLKVLRKTIDSIEKGERSLITQ